MKKIREVLLICGVVSSLLYLLGIDVVAALSYPEYHGYVSQMVSELFAEGAPTRMLMIWFNVPYNLLMLAFAVGVWATARQKRAAHLAAAALAGYAVIGIAGLLSLQMDLRGTIDSTRDVPHIIATFIMSIFLIAAMTCGAFVLGRRFLIYSFATIVTVIVFGGLAGFLAQPMPGATPGVGLAERVNIYATMIWIAVFAIGLLRAEAAVRTEGPDTFEAST